MWPSKPRSQESISKKPKPRHEGMFMKRRGHSTFERRQTRRQECKALNPDHALRQSRARTSGNALMRGTSQSDPICQRLLRGNQHRQMILRTPRYRRWESEAAFSVQYVDPTRCASQDVPLLYHPILTRSAIVLAMRWTRSTGSRVPIRIESSWASRPEDNMYDFGLQMCGESARLFCCVSVVRPVPSGLFRALRRHM